MPANRLGRLCQFLPSGSRQTSTICQQVEPLSLDELALFTVEAGVFVAIDRIHGIGHLGCNVEFIEDYCRRRTAFLEGCEVWLPHVHDAKTDPLGSFIAKPCEKGFEALLLSVLAAIPDVSAGVRAACYIYLCALYGKTRGRSFALAHPVRQRPFAYCRSCAPCFRDRALGAEARPKVRAFKKSRFPLGDRFHEIFDAHRISRAFKVDESAGIHIPAEFKA